MSHLESDIQINGREIPPTSEHQETIVPSENNALEQKLVEYKQGTILEINGEAKSAMPDLESLERSITALGYDPKAAESAYGMDTQLQTKKMEITDLRDESTKEITSLGFPRQSDTVPVPHEVQNSPEKKNIIFEHFQSKRGTILSQIITSEITSSGLNMVPFVGGGKMLVESITGSSLAGEKLSGKDRIIHGAMGAASLALDFTGIGEIKLVGKGAEIFVKLSGKMAEQRLTKGAAMMLKTAKFMADHPELTSQAEKIAEAKVRQQINTVKQYRSQTA